VALDGRGVPLSAARRGDDVSVESLGDGDTGPTGGKLAEYAPDDVGLFLDDASVAAYQLSMMRESRKPEQILLITVSSPQVLCHS
jgi:hypothetical protein